MAGHKTNILHKMVNVNFTLNEVDMTMSVEPLHHFHDNGRGYFYIWSPRQRMGGGGTYGDGFMEQLHKVSNSGNPNTGGNGLRKPKYCIKVPNKGIHTIPIHQSDIGSPNSPNATPPPNNNPNNPPYVGASGAPNEHFPHKAVRGGHGWDATTHHSWWWMYRYEWSEQGHEFVDTIVTERGIGGIGSKSHRYSGWGSAVGKCGCYTYPVIQNHIAMSGETLVINDTSLYSVTCSGETKAKGAGLTDPDNGVGDEYQEGIVITRPEPDKNGILQYRNKWKMFYPSQFHEKVNATTHSQAMSNYQNYGYTAFWNAITGGFPSTGQFPANSNNYSGSAGAAHNENYHNAYPERHNISQIARSNTQAWDRIKQIENITGVEFLQYRHSMVQRVTDWIGLNPVTFEWDHLLVQSNTPRPSTAFGHYPEPIQILNGVSVTGWTLAITDLSNTAVNIGIPIPANHNFAQNHPGYGVFTSRIYGIVRKSSTLDICGTPQVGPGNPDKGNQNWRNGLFDSGQYDTSGAPPYPLHSAYGFNAQYNYNSAHIHGAGILPNTSSGTNFGAAGPAAQQKNGGKGSISRFMSNCKKPWNGDPLRNSSLVGTQGTNPENWPDITHNGSRPDYTAMPAMEYVGRESWKWIGYDISGYTTTSTHPSNSVSWPSAWPSVGRYIRNWIGHMNNASSPFFKPTQGIPIDWHVADLNTAQWTLQGTGYDANNQYTDWHWGNDRKRFCLPSIKELDSPSYFNHIVTFEEEEDSIPDYGTGNGTHTLGYECIDCNGYGDACMPVQASNVNCQSGSVYPLPGAYATLPQCIQQCNPWGTL